MLILAALFADAPSLMALARLAIALLALFAGIAAAVPETYEVWTQAGDGTWGYVSFYPQALTIHAGDSVRFVQKYDAGIIAIPAPGNSTSQFSMAYPPGSTPGRLYLTPFAVPDGFGQGPLTYQSTVLPGEAHSGGFMFSQIVVPQFQYNNWTFTFPQTGAYDVWEILHQITITIDVVAPGQVIQTAAQVAAVQLQQWNADIARGSALTQQFIVDAGLDAFGFQAPNTWKVQTGWMTLDTQLSQTQGHPSYDRFLPGNITINAGDTIFFYNTSPHAHAIAVNSSGQFIPASANYDPVKGLFYEEDTLYLPSPTPGPNGVITCSSGFCAGGVLLQPGTNTSLKFDTPGDFALLCPFHADIGMTSVIHVLAAGSVSYPTTTTGAAAFAAPAALLVAALMALLALFA